MSGFSLEMEEASPELIAHLPWVHNEKGCLQAAASENKWINIVVPVKAHEIWIPD